MGVEVDMSNNTERSSVENAYGNENKRMRSSGRIANVNKFIYKTSASVTIHLSLTLHFLFDCQAISQGYLMLCQLDTVSHKSHCVDKCTLKIG